MTSYATKHSATKPSVIRHLCNKLNLWFRMSDSIMKDGVQGTECLNTVLRSDESLESQITITILDRNVNVVGDITGRQTTE